MFVPATLVGKSVQKSIETSSAVKKGWVKSGDTPCYAQISIVLTNPIYSLYSKSTYSNCHIPPLLLRVHLFTLVRTSRELGTSACIAREPINWENQSAYILLIIPSLSANGTSPDPQSFPLTHSLVPLNISKRLTSALISLKIQFRTSTATNESTP